MVNTETLIAARSATIASFNRLLAAFAGIALLVGGIGVMNIMLVNITERTQEIGLRMALGAHRRQIVGQFLFEAVVVSLIGGTLGVMVGIGAAQVRVGSLRPALSVVAVRRVVHVVSPDRRDLRGLPGQPGRKDEACEELR